MNAEPDAEITVKAATGGRQPAADGPSANTADRVPESKVEGAVRPEPAPREPTRRYADVSDDDRDVGWGEPPASGRDDDWYLRERPPHHG